ncbi:MAG: Na(+)-translocating NADH-quinone reductase subunit A [Bacteroidales bacterium]|nr:Na(+)-translocating NADH-quinone reductase subunit A [Bacteroidales bacterium]
MSKVIKIPKGLDIHLYGEASKEVKQTSESSFALKPLDCTGVTPKLLVDVGDKVQIGSPVFYIKQNPKVKFVSPVAGEITEVKRGAKRVIEEIRIKSDGSDNSVDFGKQSIAELTAEQIREKMWESGVWTLLRQRPYDIIPDADATPEYIIIKGFDSAPLAPDYNLLVKGEKAAIQVGIDALKKLTSKTLYLSMNKETDEEIASLQNVEKKTFTGRHPYGNVSVQAEKISPINKGMRIWYVNLQDLIVIGRLFLDGKYYNKKIVALTGEEVKNPCYYEVIRGTNIATLVSGNVTDKNLRYISGNVLTGMRIEKDGYLGYYDNQITVIEEGNYKEGLGWMMPGLKKFSISKTFLRGFTAFCSKKPVHIDSNMHGSQRAYIFTGDFEKVMPMDIYPMQLIKACLAKDIDRMEELGIYEVDAEDFALCEVIDVSKTDVQDIIRQGLNLMREQGL